MKLSGPLAEREYRLLFAGRTVSTIGNAIAPIGLAFAVLSLTGSRADLGYVLAARSLPQIVFLLAGGVWADRLPRHQVMVVSSVVSGASQTTVGVLLLTGNARLWELAALGAVNGTSSAFFFPANTGVVPQTVPASLLQQANALLRLSRNATNIGGAAIGGALVAATSPGTAIVLDGASFALGAVFIGAMRLPSGLRMQGSHFLGDLHEGWREFTSRTWLWAIVVQFSVVNAAEVGAINVIGPTIAKAHLGGAGAWGIVLAAQAAGLVLSGLFMMRFRPRRILLVATFAIFPMALFPLSLAHPLPLAGVIAAAFIAGFFVEIFGVLWDVAMQNEIPTDRLSRVSSYDALGSWGFIPLGLAAAGPLADAFGTRDTLFGAAVLVVVPTALVLLSRDVRTLGGPAR